MRALVLTNNEYIVSIYLVKDLNVPTFTQAVRAVLEKVSHAYEVEVHAVNRAHCERHRGVIEVDDCNDLCASIADDIAEDQE
jgi:hypothetical protein